MKMGMFLEEPRLRGGQTIGNADNIAQLQLDKKAVEGWGPTGHVWIAHQHTTGDPHECSIHQNVGGKPILGSSGEV